MGDSKEMQMRRSPVLYGVRRASVFNRALARGIDLLLLFVVYALTKALWAPLAPAVALALAAFGDGLGDGQSFGKKMMGLRVVDEPTEAACDYAQSFQRNLPFVFATLCLVTPPLRLFFILGGLPLIGFEAYLVLAIETGVRLGDVLGNTTVLEAQEFADDSSGHFPAE